MRANILRGGALVLDTVADPVPAAGQALIRTLACGICGTDLHFMKNGAHMVDQWRRSGADLGVDLTRDIILGHEYCGEILDYGPGSARPLKTGSHVIAFPTNIGMSNDLPGGFAQQMLLDETLLIEIPNGLAPEHAALTEPMAVGLHAMNMARLGVGDAPLVIGCGPVGLAVIAALSRAGHGPIVAADFSPARRRLAERLGAHIVVDPATTSPYDSWTQATAGHHRDGATAADTFAFFGVAGGRAPVVFECTGVVGVMQQILENVPRHARIVAAGMCSAIDRFEPMMATMKEVSIQFSVAYTPDEFSRTLRDIAEGVVDIPAIITSKVTLDEVGDAVTRLANPERDAKIIIEPNRSM